MKKYVGDFGKHFMVVRMWDETTQKVETPWVTHSCRKRHHLFYVCHLPWRRQWHSSTLAWKIPWTEEPGGPQSMGSQRVGHDWATSLSFFSHLSLLQLFGIIFWKLSLNLPQPTSQQCLCLHLCISISCSYLFTSSFHSLNKP